MNRQERIIGIRGATTCENTPDSIRMAAVELMDGLLTENELTWDDLISVIISTTADLTAAYAAKFVRESGCSAPLFSTLEPPIEGALPHCIRVLITASGRKTAAHLYLRGARILRPDLAGPRANPLSIAIDGPSGAGKSTVARLIAKRLGIAYLDTGAMYRALALHMVRRGILCGETARVAEELQNVAIDIRCGEGSDAIFLNGENVSAAIRENTVSRAASDFSAVLAVREKMVAMQREIAAERDCVLDGRDIGTVVLPGAKYKFFLTASIEARAERRYRELCGRGQGFPELAQVVREIEERDYRDSHREVSPLCQADDAVLIDSTALAAEAVADKILSYIQKR